MLGQGGRGETQRVLCPPLLAALVLLAWPAGAQAAISVNDVQVSETNGAVTATFTLTRTTSGLFVPAASVSFETVDGSARAPGDYVAVKGTTGFDGLLIGDTQTQVVPVVVGGDALDEPDESFRLVLSGGEVVDREGTGTIVDDDPTPALGVADAPPATEGATATFAIALSAPSGRDVAVAFATADGSATAGEDYSARAGTVTIPAGSTQAALGVALIDDGADEPSETFELRLSAPAAAGVRDGAATATILDDDDPASSSPGPASPSPSAQQLSPVLSLPTQGSTTGASPAGRPRLGISSPRLRRPDTVLVTLACPKATARCTGRMTIFSRPYRRSKIVALRRERRLRRTTFVVLGGGTKTFELKLSRLDRRLLHRAGRMSVRAYVVTSDEVRTVNGTLIARTIHSSPSRR